MSVKRVIRIVRYFVCVRVRQCAHNLFLSISIHGSFLIANQLFERTVKISIIYFFRFFYGWWAPLSLSLNFDAAAVVIHLYLYTSFIPPNLQLEIIKEQTRIDWSTLTHSLSDTHLHIKLKIIGFFSSHIIVTSCKCGFAKLPLTIAPIFGWWKSKNI